jgi:hypothetical protein
MAISAIEYSWCVKAWATVTARSVVSGRKRKVGRDHACPNYEARKQRMTVPLCGRGPGTYAGSSAMLQAFNCISINLGKGEEEASAIR